MTTTAAPPLIVPAVDVSELPAWDQPDERACEWADLHADDTQVPCHSAAAWADSVRCPCDDVTGVQLGCERHHADVLDPEMPQRCDICYGEVDLIWSERIR